MRFLVHILLIVAVSVSLTRPSYAQDATSTTMTGTRKQLATIIFAGLGGAVLGLSTLSFYGRPQDYMANIAIGFAFGIIAGTVIVTFRTATNPNELNGNLLNDSPSGSALGYMNDVNSRGYADVLSQSRNQPTLQLGWNF